MRFIKDEEFIRGTVPMTKENIRLLTMSKLNLDSEDSFLDIGCGTGSISIQGAKFCKLVTSIDKEDDAIETTKKNIEKFKCENITLIKGEAKETLLKLKEKFDAIFIGGSGGNLEEIIDLTLELLKPNGRLVANFITLVNAVKMAEYLTKKGLQVETTLLQVSTAKGKSLMLSANNPIFIIKVQKEK